MVIPVPYPKAKVAYQSRRLHKNTFRGTRSTSARMIRTDLTIYLLPRLPCSEGSLSLCGEGRLVGEGECMLHVSNPRPSASQGIFVETS